MKKIKYLSILLITMLFIGCSNAEERMNSRAMSEIERGNFIKASYLLNNAIKINPDYLDGVVNYRNVYPRAIDQANENVEEYKKVSAYQLEAYSYEDLLKLKNNYYYADPIIHRKLGLSIEIPTIEELYKLKSTMGETYYLAGNELENRELNRNEKRERYYLYERGVELSPDYLDIVNRREAAYKDALVKAMFKFSYNTPYSSQESLALQVKSNIAKGRKQSLVRILPFEKRTFDTAWRNSDSISKINTGIEVNMNYITKTPESLQRKIVPLTWNEEYIVQTKKGPEKRTIKRNYFRYDYYKSSSVEVSFTYIMKDLSTGEIIGSGDFKGIGGDSYRWSTYSGNIPSGQGRNGYTRKLRSQKELEKIALEDAITKISKDISEKI